MARGPGRRQAVSMALAAAAVGTSSAGRAVRAVPAGIALAQLVAPAAALAIGMAARRAVPERNAAALASALADRLSGANGESAASAAEAVRWRLGQAIAGDFAAGRMVSVDGWQLSVTEARLCTLMHLAGPGFRLNIG